MTITKSSRFIAERLIHHFPGTTVDELADRIGSAEEGRISLKKLEEIAGLADLKLAEIKANTCPFDSCITCHRNRCNWPELCDVLINRLDFDPEINCLKCGANKVIHREVFGEEHKCYVSKGS